MANQTDFGLLLRWIELKTRIEVLVSLKVVLVAWNNHPVVFSLVRVSNSAIGFADQVTLNMIDASLIYPII